jgi:hypothetical protein
VVFLVLLLSLGVLGYANVQLHRQHLEAAQLSAAERLSDVVKRSTAYYMLRNDREALRYIVQTIGKEPGIERLRIMNDRGRVVFSTNGPEIGSIVHIPARACRCNSRASTAAAASASSASPRRSRTPIRAPPAHAMRIRSRRSCWGFSI